MMPNDDAIELSDEEYAAIDAAAPYEAGKAVPLSEAIKRAEDRKNAWLTTQPKDRTA